MELEAHSILALPESCFRLLFRRVRESVVKVEDRMDALYPSSRQGEPGHDAHARSREVQQEPEREKLEAVTRDKELAAQKHGRGEDNPPQKTFMRRRPYLLILAGAFCFSAAIAGYTWWKISSQYESTDDAFIQARFFSIDPKVSGYITSVPVTDNQWVEAGATVATIDERDYKTALAQSEAQLAQAEASIPNIDAQIAGQQQQIVQAQAQINDAEAALKFTQQQNIRAQELKKTGSGTVQSAQQTTSQLLEAQANADRTRAAFSAAQKQLAALQAQRVSAQASIAMARAERDQANLNIAYTAVKTDQAGRITELTAAKGQFVQAGQSLMVVVPNPMWIVANFRETQISQMRPGQPVDIRVDAYPKRTFKGHLDSIQSGSGTVFSLLPAENATGNYVKVVQRVPVKIVFDEKPDVVLGPGMSVVPWVHVR